MLLILDKPLKEKPQEQFQSLLELAGIENNTVLYLSINEDLEGICKDLNPKLILAFGDKVFEHLFQMPKVLKWRGSILEWNGIKTIPTIHPEQILKGGGTSYWYKPAVFMDLIKAKEESKTNEKAHKVRTVLIRQAKQLDAFFNRVAGTNGYCSFDIETTLRGGEAIRCIGFANDITTGYVVPIQDLDTLEGLKMIEMIKSWMTGYSIKWIGQNAYGFDINYMQRVWKFEVKNFFFDTMVAHHVLYPEFPHDLGFLTSMYTRIAYYKEEITENLYPYNAKDAVGTFIIADKQFRELHKRNLSEHYFDYYHQLLTPLREMSHRGVAIDKKWQKQLKEDLECEIEILQNEINSIFLKHTNTFGLERRLRRVERFLESERKTVKLWNPKTRKSQKKRKVSFVESIKKTIEGKKVLNVGSTPGMQNFLYNVLKLPKQYKNKKLTTDETALGKMFIATKHPFLKTIIKLRKTRKSLSDYGKMTTDYDGRVRTTYSFAETGRLKSGKFDAK